MRPTKSQFDRMQPVVLMQAAQAVGSLSSQLGNAVAQIEGAQRTVDGALSGKFGDAVRDRVAGKTADLHWELDSLAKIQSSLGSAADQMVTATNNVRCAVQTAEALGYGVRDDWSLRSGELMRSIMRPGSDTKELQAQTTLQAQITDAVNAWDEADKNAAEQSRRAVQCIAVKAQS